MTGIQEILRVFFFSLLLLHDLMLAFSCNVLYYVAPVYFWAIWAHFHFSTSTWLDAQKKWNWQSYPSTHFLPVDYREHVIILNIPYLLIFSCFMYLMYGVIAIIFKWGLEKNLDNFLFCLVFSSFRLLRKNSNQFHVISKVHHIRNASLRVIYFRIVCSNKRKKKKTYHCYLATSLTTKITLL